MCPRRLGEVDADYKRVFKRRGGPLLAHHVNSASEAICPELDEKRKCFARARYGGCARRISSGGLAMLMAYAPYR
jgi:hypothetical protein